LQGFDALFIRHEDVANDQIEMLLLETSQTVIAVHRQHGIVAGVLQYDVDDAAHFSHPRLHTCTVVLSKCRVGVLPSVSVASHGEVMDADDVAGTVDQTEAVCHHGYDYGPLRRQSVLER